MLVGVIELGAGELESWIGRGPLDADSVLLRIDVRVHTAALQIIYHELGNILLGLLIQADARNRSRDVAVAEKNPIEAAILLRETWHILLVRGDGEDEEIIWAKIGGVSELGSGQSLFETIADHVIV